MADTKSFFERLTGSVRIQSDDTGKEMPIEPVAEPTAEVVAERPADRRVSSFRRKKTGDDDANPQSVLSREEVEELVATHSKQPAPASVAAPAPVAAPEPVLQQPEPRTVPQERQEEESEGQLTVDIYDDGDTIVIQSTVAGVSPEDLDLSVTNDMVTLKGRRRRAQAIREEDYYYKELYWGAFSRSVILPEEVESDEAEASLKNGMLTVRLPKKNQQVMKKIRVKMD